MKKILLTLLLFGSIIWGQTNLVYDGTNSTLVNLAGSATFTGSWKECNKYSSIRLVVYSTKSSATNGIKIQFKQSLTGTTKTRAWWTYTANDSSSEYVTPIQGAYYRVIYTNSTDSQTSFTLTSFMTTNNSDNYDNTGNKKVTLGSGTNDVGNVNVNESALIDTTNERLSQLIEQQARRLDSLGNRISQNLYLLEKIRDNQTNGSQTIAQTIIDSLQKYLITSERWEYKKWLSGATDTVIINPGMNYKYIIVGIRDSSDSNTDTLKVLYKSAITGAYTSELMGFIELYSNIPLGDNTTVVPGQGKEKQYIINRIYPGATYITWKTTAAKSSRKCLIYAYGWTK